MTELRQLWLLRHAKSAWNTDAPTDFDRPLNDRGKRDAPRMGRWMARQGLVPDQVLASPARRAKQTVKRVYRELGVPIEQVVWDQRIYEADVPTLLEVLAEIPDPVRRVLLVGHNPGLSDLLEWMAGPAPEAGVKLLPTAALARLELACGWRDLASGKARLIEIVRPKSLPPEI